MAASDLTNLAAVRDWCGIMPSVTQTDALLSRLITSASAMIIGYLGRPPLYSQTITERYDGNGGERLMLRRWPVTTLSAVAVDNVAITPAVLPGPGATTQIGYLLEPWDGMLPGRQQSVDLYGCNSFFFGRQNVVVTYTYGYLVASEAQTVPTGGGPVNVFAPYGPWSVDGGVVMNGVAMTPVTGTPSTGQYQLVADTPGQYVFAAADAGNSILISYSFIPADIADACTSLVGERYRYKSRIGEVSKGAGGETTTYSQKDMPDNMKLQLQPYRKVTIF
jgi:hypothetical protein